jgi:two-component system, cell cycle sensor histidine kinase and response regulator CckA
MSTVGEGTPERIDEQAARRETIFRAVSFAAANLLQHAPDDDVIEAVLARLGAAVTASRAFIFANHQDPLGPLRATLSHEWHAPGLAPMRARPTLRAFAYHEAGLDRWAQLLGSGNPLAGPTTSLPPAERAFAETAGIRSQALVPLFAGDRWWGALGLAGVDPRRDWQPAELDALKMTARLLGAAFQRHDDEAALRRRARELDVLNRVVAAASGALEPVAVLETTCRELARALGADQAGAALVVPGASYLEVVAEYNGPGFPSAVGSHIPIEGNPLTQHILDTAEPVVIADVAGDPLLDPVRDLMDLRNVASILLLPISVGERVVGTLGLDSRTVRTFSPDEIALAASATAAAAQVLDKARLLEAEQRNAARLEEILALSIEIAALPGEPDLLQHLTARVAAIAGSATCTAFVVDDQEDAAILVAQHGVPGGEGRRLPLDTPLLQQALADHQLVVPDIDRDTPELRHYLTRTDLHSFQAYPMVSQDEMLGFLTIGYTAPYQPSPAEVNAFRLLAERAGAALRSARLLQRLQQQTAHLSALHNVQLAVSTSLDPEMVYRTIVGHAADLVHCDLVNLLLWDSDHGIFSMLASYHNGAITIGDERQPLPAESALPQLLDRRKPLAIPDARADDRLNPAWRDRHGVRAALIVPLRYRDRPSGFLVCADTTSPRQWEPIAITLAESLAVHAGNAVANARLHAATRRLLQRTRNQARAVQQILDTVPDGLILLDAHTRILLANPLALDQLPVLTNATIGDRLHSLAGVPVATLLEKPPPGRSGHEIIVREPRRRVFEINAQPMLTGPQAGGWVLVIDEITTEREQQDYLQAQDRLATVGQLAAGIAHDFNNIMAVIVLYAQTLLMSKPEGREQERLSVIYQQAQQASRLIGQILDFSRRSVVERRPLDIIPFLKELVRMLQRTLPETIDLDFSFSEGDYVVDADPTRLQQALMNLAVNARDAMPEGGTLTLTLSRHGPDWPTPLPDMRRGHWVRLEVRDTGEGINTADLPHIFEPFYTTKEPGKGTGLGLAQVYGIVKQHDGFIHVTSRSGQGTSFQLYLPAFILSAPQERPEPPAIPDALPGETILVVEDEESIREAVAATLEGLNYRVLTAPNGEVALAIYRQDHAAISLVLSDLVMPRMGGAALYDALRDINPNLRMLIFTGYPLEDANRDFIERSGVDWVQKPFTAETLARALRHTLDGE